MGFMSVHVYRANGNNQKWADRALSALSALESQVDFNIYTYDEGSVSVNIGDNHYEMLDNWEQHVENNISINQYGIHLLCVNTTKFGAGAMRGAVGPAGGQVAGSDGCVGHVNAAVRFNNSCYNAETYKPTVIHEVGHAALHDGMDMPDGDNEHSLGAVLNDSDDTVTPMQLWYTGDPCSGNSPPSDNCNGRPTVYSGGATNDLSSCSKPLMNDYMDSF